MGKFPREEERYYLWLNRFVGHQVRLFWALCRENGPRPKEVFEAAAQGQLKPPRPQDASLVKTLHENARETVIDDYMEELDRKGIHTLTLVSTGYPALLANISDPPTVIFYRGNFMEPELPLAIVGARRSTRYGQDAARSFAKKLVEYGACIVSGMASGVDTAAAEGSLEVADSICPTIAVLGGGVDVIYPSQNMGLYERIIERGAVISEFAPGTRPQKGFFPLRNRIISGLSLGVLVTEAGERSGASITISSALEQGRETFALPGRITDRMSAGTNRMIRDGMAAPVLSPEDILRAFGLDSRQEVQIKKEKIPLSPLEKRIYMQLSCGEESFDELCEKLGVSAAELNSALTSLEFSGIIKQLPGRVYELAADIF